MIHCNLNVLLAQRNLKIADVHKATGISRTTLTSLAYGHAKGIQFDTLSTLCNYLQVSPSELLLDQSTAVMMQNGTVPASGKFFPCMVFLPGNFKYDISEQEKTGNSRKNAEGDFSEQKNVPRHAAATRKVVNRKKPANPPKTENPEA